MEIIKHTDGSFTVNEEALKPEPERSWDAIKRMEEQHHNQIAKLQENWRVILHHVIETSPYSDEMTLKLVQRAIKAKNNNP